VCTFPVNSVHNCNVRSEELLKVPGRLLQPLILLLELLQSLHLRRHQAATLLAPVLVRRLADAGFAADRVDRRPFFRLPQDESDLLLAEP